jgi:hypothetical protein
VPTPSGEHGIPFDDSSGALERHTLEDTHTCEMCVGRATLHRITLGALGALGALDSTLDTHLLEHLTPSLPVLRCSLHCCCGFHRCVGTRTREDKQEGMKGSLCLLGREGSEGSAQNYLPPVLADCLSPESAFSGRALSCGPDESPARVRVAAGLNNPSGAAPAAVQADVRLQEAIPGGWCSSER